MASKAETVAAAFPVLPAEVAVGDLLVTFAQVLAGPKGVVVTGRVTRDGEPVFVDWPVIVVNAPLRAVTEGGAVIDDPALALAQVVAGVAGG